MLLKIVGFSVCKTSASQPYSLASMYSVDFIVSYSVVMGAQYFLCGLGYVMGLELGSNPVTIYSIYSISDLLLVAPSGRM